MSKENKFKEFFATSWAIDNRTSVYVLAVLITVLGMMNYYFIPKEQFPQVVIPYIIVSTPYPGTSPEDIENLVTTNKLLTYQLRKTEEELAKYTDPNALVPLPPDLQGKVVAVDPKWNFVVINVGQRQGVLARGEILISREGKLVARVKVRDVENDRCIANVMPGWKLADIFEGDVASSCQ